jgi:hypothetical protein
MGLLIIQSTISGVPPGAGSAWEGTGFGKTVYETDVTEKNGGDGFVIVLPGTASKPLSI